MDGPTLFDPIPASSPRLGGRAPSRPPERASGLGPIRSRWECRLALLLVLLPGCANRGNVLTGGPSVGQLKTSVSHLEYENEQLKTQVAKLNVESRSMEDRLVQEQIHNGDLTARLDDARNLLRDRGVELSSRPAKRSVDGDDPDADLDGIPSPRTTPAGRTSRKPRKPPAAQIGKKTEELPLAPGDDASENSTITLRDDPSPPPRRARKDQAPPLNVEDDDLKWQPVATGTGSADSPRR